MRNLLETPLMNISLQLVEPLLIKLKHSPQNVILILQKQFVPTYYPLSEQFSFGSGKCKQVEQIIA